MLIKTISTKRLFFDELSIYRKNDNKQIDKNFIITETSRIHQLIETRRCRISDQSSRMRLKYSDLLNFEFEIFNSKRLLSIRIKNLTSIETF
jgi:hypothetical protein